jgi:hypothetical protein
MTQLIITISEVLRPYAELATVRLGYLYPKMSFSCQVHTILISSETEIDEITTRRDILYALYREKIYAETLSMRQALVTMVSTP